MYAVEERRGCASSMALLEADEPSADEEVEEGAGLLVPAWADRRKLPLLPEDWRDERLRQAHRLPLQASGIGQSRFGAVFFQG